MHQRLYCIYDLKAEAMVGSVVQVLSTDAEAVRMFASVVSTPGSLVSEHPSDFNLLCLGTLDRDTLKVTPNLQSLHVPVATGYAVVREMERARNASSVPADGPEAVMRDQLSLAPS